MNPDIKVTRRNPSSQKPHISSNQSKEAEQDDPWLEKLTESLVIAFLAAALVKVGIFVYGFLWPSLEDK